MGFDASSVLRSVTNSTDRLALISALLAVEQGSSQIEVPTSRRGYVFYDGPGRGGRVTDECMSYLFMSGINLLDYRVLALAYGLAMAWLFLGIAIISDVFMGAIEVITSQEKEKVVVSRNGVRSLVTYSVWNPTVANLTLMALGSSAPEIVLAIYGTIATLDMAPDELGPATIVGSAAFNLFVITAICMASLPGGESKKVEQLGVFGITAVASLFAYLWLYLVLRVISPGVIELWEGVLTFLFFPLLVFIAYQKDIGFRWCSRGGSREEDEQRSSDPFAKPPTAEQLAKNAAFAERRAKRASVSEVTGSVRRERHSLRQSQHAAQQPFAASSTDGDAPPGAELRQSVRILEPAGIKRSNTGSSGWRENQRALSNLVFTNDTDETEARSPRSAELAALMRTLTHIRDVEQQNRTIYGALERSSTHGEGDFKVRPVGMRHRMDAVRALTGQRRLVDNSNRPQRPSDPLNRADSRADSRGGDSDGGRGSKHESGRSMWATAMHRTSSGGLLADDADVSIFAFIQPTFVASAAWTHAVATVVRRGASDTDVRVGWATVPPSSPRANKVFKASSGELNFSANGNTTAVIRVPLTAGELADPAPFQIALTSVVGSHASLSKRSKTTIRTVPKKAPPAQQPKLGQLQFAQPEVTCSELVGSLQIKVERVDGSDGVLELNYRTLGGSALPDVDYTPISGTLEFGPCETVQMLSVPIHSASTGAHGTVSFSLELFQAGALSTEARGELPCDVCDVTILDESTWKERVDETVQQVRQEIAADFYSTATWAEQFRNAIILSGGVNEETGAPEEPSLFDSIMHMLSFFWKVLFACVPPTTIWNGWAAFLVSLMFIAVCTAAVSEFASAFGCVLGVPDAVTAITIVALGTSLPDTFASRLSILRDETADNAVGNVTGSNSVNVFLGLGVPWIIGAAYHGSAPTGLGVYEVPSAGLAFSVVVFGAFALATLALLMVRRVTVGGEVGGSKVGATLSAIFLFSLWVMYVIVSSLYITGQLTGVPI